MSGLQRALDAVRGHPRAADAALALLLAALVQWEILTTDVTGPKSLLVPAGLAVTIPLAWRRTAPLAALLFVMAAAAAAGLAAADSDEVAQAPQMPFLAEVLAVYSVAAHAERRPALIGLLVSWAALLAAEPGDFVVMGPAWAGIWLAGRLVRAREQDARRMRELAEALERERVEEARLAVVEERTRIARELHDVVAHAMTTIVLEAGAERVNLDEGQASARQALHSIERTGRQALVEMRRLVGVLRTKEDEPELLFPQPSLTQLDLLIEHVGRAGLAVELRVVGEPVQLAPGLDISAYRIVQEALTNVLKHGGDARATVVVAYGDRTLEIEIADDGRGGRPDGSGHGIVGLRERVALFGGSLEAGGREGGGFAVLAKMPLEKWAP
jgi:signal transduction histidine kinase